MTTPEGDSATRLSAGLRISDPAPGFSARSTAGPLRMADMRGAWLLFFSHPADFTPVCTSEFVALARAAPQFAALGCRLLALSVDSLYSHVAWLRDIEDRTGVQVPFPVVEDPSMTIARAYGMLDPSARNSATVRASFVIDPEGIIRAITWYPMSVGRNIEELLRLVTALQTSDSEQASTPADWHPGDPLLEPGALTLDEARGRGDGATPWYMVTRATGAGA